MTKHDPNLKPIEAHADAIPALSKALAQIDTRRVSIAETVAAASQTMLDLRLEQDAAASKLAFGGRHDGPAAVALADKLRNAEASFAAARNAEHIVEVEHERVSALLVDSRRLAALDAHAKAIASARAIGAAFDAKADELNALFDRWKLAVIAARASWPAHVSAPMMMPLFPDAGAGVIGARPLHQEIVRSICSMGGLHPGQGRVADYG